MSFVFRLEKILKYKRFLEQSAKKEFGVALMETARQELKLKALVRSIKEAEKEIEKNCLLGIETSRYRILMHSLAGLKKDAERLSMRIDELKKEADKKKAAFFQARRERRAIEKVKENKMGLHAKAGEQQEQKLADEMALMRIGNRG